MAARCPVCGSTGRHAADCLYRARTPEGTTGGCLLVVLPYVGLAALAAVVITLTGSWPDVARQVHQLAHYLAPGVVGP